MRKYLPVILLAVQCVIIFSFSAQPATESAQVSGGLLQKILGWLPVTRMLDSTELGFAEHILRKTAHFSLYLLLGIYAYLSGYTLNLPKKCVFSLGFCLTYAISDEIHQLFSPGRSCEIKDVFIDFAGSTVGVILTVLVIYILTKNKKMRGEQK